MSCSEISIKKSCVTNSTIGRKEREIKPDIHNITGDILEDVDNLLKNHLHLIAVDSEEKDEEPEPPSSITV